MTFKKIIQILCYLILLSNLVFGVENIDDVMKEFKERELTKDSLIYPIWVESEEVLFYKRIYLYHVTNPDAVLEGNKPKFQEMGPYVYRVHTQKMNANFSDDQGTVTYDKSNWYEFLPEKSSGSLNDVITVLNVPYYFLAKQLEGKLDASPREIIDNLIEFYDVKPFVNKTVMEMLYKGYRDKFMIHLGNLKGRQILPGGRYGYYYGQNFATEAFFTVYTGLTEKNKFLQVHKWNGMEKFPYYNDDEKCNKFEGSSEGGCVFKPDIQTSDTLQLFTTDMCRTLPLKYEKQVDYVGVSVYKFIPQLENKCNDENSTKSGVLSLEICKENEPLMVSFPHFYQADVSYLEAVEGLNPDKSKHESYFDIEPTVGVTMHSHKKLQMNVAIKPIHDTGDFNHLPEIVFPLTWYDEASKWPENYVESFKKVL